jgi:hypothetical protein
VKVAFRTAKKYLFLESNGQEQEQKVKYLVVDEKLSSY